MADIQLTLYTHMRDERLRAGRLFINGAIGDGASEMFYDYAYYVRRGYAGVLDIYLNSPGGMIHEALAIHDMIRTLSPANVTAVGMAASAAAMIVLQAGDRRFATPNTRLMLHELAQGVVGYERQSETQDRAKELKRVQGQLLSILSARTGKTPKEIAKAMGRRDLWLDAQEALAWGLIDEIRSDWKWPNHSS